MDGHRNISNPTPMFSNLGLTTRNSYCECPDIITLPFDVYYFTNCTNFPVGLSLCQQSKLGIKKQCLMCFVLRSNKSYKHPSIIITAYYPFLGQDGKSNSTRGNFNSSFLFMKRKAICLANLEQMYFNFV